MSWFSGISAKLQEVTEQVAEHAKNAIPLDKEMLEKLTLTTPELSAERKRIDDEEKRKEHIKDCLAGMLPWETRDPERDILVEECKEVIMKLSNDEATFKGPYLMPNLTVKLTESEDEDEKDDDENEGVDEEKEKDDETEKPSEESLDKLAKLEPLPKLLKDFDLDAHVGLIQRLLEVDPDLVEMQSKLSGGGEREHYFWKNYFFHCAYARYEAGLSIDEIWNDEDPSVRKAKQEAEAAQQKMEASAHNVEEETITFDHHNEDPATASAAKTSTTTMTQEVAFSTPEPETDMKASESLTTSDDPGPSASVVGSSVADSSAHDYENINSEYVDDGLGEGWDENDVELDELEAEIARELED